MLSTLYTLFLFTKSDTVLVVFPMLAVALVLVGPTSLILFASSFVWLELHLLSFDIKNQYVGIEEDRICKPDRPFPSGRISLHQGQRLYLAVVAVSIGFSMYQDLTFISLAYFLAIFCYNELSLSSNPIAKSPVGAFGYMCYSWGTTYIMGNYEPLNRVSIQAIVASGLIFSFTGHAQDFRDRSGDSFLGRKTIPLLLPQSMARISLFLLMAIFTHGLIILWMPPLVVSIIFAVLGLITSCRFLVHWEEEADRKSFKWYELWLLCAHTLPIFERISNGDISFPQALSFLNPDIAIWKKSILSILGI